MTDVQDLPFRVRESARKIKCDCGEAHLLCEKMRSGSYRIYCYNCRKDHYEYWRQTYINPPQTVVEEHFISSDFYCDGCKTQMVYSDERDEIACPFCDFR